MTRGGVGQELRHSQRDPEKIQGPVFHAQQRSREQQGNKDRLFSGFLKFLICSIKKLEVTTLLMCNRSKCAESVHGVLLTATKLSWKSMRLAIKVTHPKRRLYSKERE